MLKLSHIDWSVLFGGAQAGLISGGVNAIPRRFLPSSLASQGGHSGLRVDLVQITIH